MIAAPTSRYLDQLRHAHEGHIRCKLYSAGVLIGELPIQSIRLTIDGRAEIWRTADIEVGLDYWETEARDWLEQANVQTGEVTIEHGIKWTPQDVVDWVQIARLRIDQLNMSLLRAGRTLTAYDRALLLSEHGLPTTRPLNNTYVNLIKTLVAETLPGETVTVESGVNTTLRPAAGRSLGLGSNRLTEIVNLGESIDAVLHNTETGAFRISKMGVTTPPVWNIDAGATGVLVGLTQDFARAEQYNAVGIEFNPDSGTDLDFYKYVYVWDDTPSSPTYYHGPFGKRAIFFQEEYDHLPSQAEAERVAIRKLGEYTGATRGLAITATYNPLLQPRDRITVDFPDTGERETHIIESLSLDLGGSATMSIETRLQRETTFAVSHDVPPDNIPLVMPELIPPEERILEYLPALPPTEGD